MKIIIFFLIVSILFESTITTLPLSLLIIIFAAIVIRKSEVFFPAFFSGLFLDILRLGTIGASSAYFVVIVMVIFAYHKKLEITSLHFVLLIALFGVLGYLLLVGANQIIAQSLASTLLIMISFFVFKKTNKKVLKYA